MQIQINSSNSVAATEKFIAWASGEIRQELERFSTKITRIEVHFSDVHIDKSGTVEISCTLEARLEGMQPVAVHQEAADLPQSLNGALEKIKKVVDRSLDKLDHKKGRTPFGGEPFGELPHDPNLEESVDAGDLEIESVRSSRE